MITSPIFPLISRRGTFSLTAATLITSMICGVQSNFPPKRSTTSTWEPVEEFGSGARLLHDDWWRGRGLRYPSPERSTAVGKRDRFCSANPKSLEATSKKVLAPGIGPDKRAAAGLHLLNLSLVMNHLVQYEGIVNCRLGC